MPRAGIKALALALFFLGPTPLRAGLYSMEAPPPMQVGLYSKEAPPPVLKLPRGGVKDLAPERFRGDFLPALRVLTVAKPESALRHAYLERKEDLERKQRRGRLSEAEQITLSYYLVRLGQPIDALKLLRDLDAQGSRNFMVFANLATVHLMLAAAATNPGDRMNDLGYAKYYVSKMNRYWPKEWPGWSKEQLAGYQEAEKYFTTLIHQRLAEARDKVKRPAGGEDRPFDNVDDLFGLKVAGAEAKYEPGKPPGGAKLTGQELPVVQQLLTWLPGDNRLYWLFGEVLNASGDVPLAAKVLEDCVRPERGLSTVPLLREHRRLLNEALRKAPKETGEKAAGEKTSKDSWLPDAVQSILVGTGVGVVIAFLVFFQIREIRRRRLRRPQPRSR